MDAQNEEFQLKELENLLSDLKKMIRMVIIKYVKAVKKNIVMMVCLAISSVAGIYYYVQSHKIYKATASYVYIELNKKTYGEMIDKLENLIISHSYNKLSNELKIPTSSLKQIVAIKALNQSGSPLSEDITETNKVFYIELKAKDAGIFDTMQYALENYLNNNILIRQIVTKNILKTKQEIQYKNTELAGLDTMLKTYTKSMGWRTDLPLSNNNTGLNPVQLMEKGEKINKEIQDMQSLVSDYRAVQTQDKFLANSFPDSKSLTWIVLCSILLFILLSILYLAIISIYKK